MGLTSLITAFRGWSQTLHLWLLGPASAAERGEVLELQDSIDEGLLQLVEELDRFLAVRPRPGSWRGGVGPAGLRDEDLPQLVEERSFGFLPPDSAAPVGAIGVIWGAGRPALPDNLALSGVLGGA